MIDTRCVIQRLTAVHARTVQFSRLKCAPRAQQVHTVPCSRHSVRHSLVTLEGDARKACEVQPSYTRSTASASTTALRAASRRLPATGSSQSCMYLLSDGGARKDRQALPHPASRVPRTAYRGGRFRQSHTAAAESAKGAARIMRAGAGEQARARRPAAGRARHKRRSRKRGRRAPHARPSQRSLAGCVAGAAAREACSARAPRRRTAAPAIVAAVRALRRGGCTHGDVDIVLPAGEPAHESSARRMRWVREAHASTPIEMRAHARAPALLILVGGNIGRI
jgi:hypothetical protein